MPTLLGSFDREIAAPVDMFRIGPCRDGRNCEPPNYTNPHWFQAWLPFRKVNTRTPGDVDDRVLLPITYSYLSALTGSIRVARWAGMIVASSATAARATGMTAKVTGSSGEMPYSTLAIN